MKKRISVLMLTLALCLSLGAPALAAGGFSDVAQNAWYLKYLDTAVSSGLINGRGDGRFSPDDDITGAEAVKLAACIALRRLSHPHQRFSLVRKLHGIRREKGYPCIRAGSACPKRPHHAGRTDGYGMSGHT